MLQVVRQIKQRSQVKLKRKDITYELWRLDDAEFRNIYDDRGTLYINFYRVLEAEVEGYDTQILREPFEIEFSCQEINYFISYFYGYLEGCFQSRRLLIPSEQFFKKIGSEYILYGYKDEHYFEEKYQSQSVYLAAIESLESIGISSISSENVNNILQTITSEIIEN
jgi:hypothetical protein